jgi:ribosome-associated translation inhibitor RaiA
MWIRVTDRGGEGDEGLKNYVWLRLLSSLGPLERQVRGVAAALVDDAAPGKTKIRCGMVALLSTREVRVEEAGADAYAAIDRAAQRLAQAVAPLGPSRRLARSPAPRAAGGE